MNETQRAVEAHLLSTLSDAGIKGAELVSALQTSAAYALLSLGETSSADDIAAAAAQAARRHVTINPPAPPAAATPAAKAGPDSPVSMADLVARHGAWIEKASVTTRLTYARALAEERAGPGAKTSFAQQRAKPVAKVSLQELEEFHGKDVVTGWTAIQKLKGLGILQDARAEAARRAAAAA